MATLFLICTLVGGTILLLQFVLSLIGLGFEHFSGVSDLGGADASVGDLVGDLDMGHGQVGDIPDGDLPDGDVGPSTTHGDHQGLMRLGRLLTFQTVLAFVTFFGVGGLAMLEAQRSMPVATLTAMGTGLGAMLTVGILFGSLHRLHGDGSLRLDALAGAPGRVYLSIPGYGEGVGKATIVTQGREVELAARTPGPLLRSGDAVVVTRRLDERTVEVVAAASYVAKDDAAARMADLV
jgi:hypothetical protein